MRGGGCLNGAHAPFSDVGARDAEFTRRLVNAQSRLFSFICSLLGSSRHARDVLQETNMVLLAKVAQYDFTRDFQTWAFTFARFQVMAHFERQSRDRIAFDGQLLDRIAARAALHTVNLDDRLAILDDCIAKLPARHRTVLLRRYNHGKSLEVIASETGQRPNALAVLLHRVRLALAKCVEQTEAPGAGEPT
jgi:RNA polymerase sigma-70 factor, ECF subfamily